MALAPKRPPAPASLADLEALQPGIKGEVIEGTLHTQPRPRPAHQVASARLFGAADRAKRNDGGRKGGWVIVQEPGISLPDAAEFSPDVAGWRVETYRTNGPDGPICSVPDWVCEVLSPSNRTYDQRVKFPFYARQGVGWLWVVDLDARSVEVRRNTQSKWLVEAFFSGDDVLQAAPFEDVAIPLQDVWLNG